MAMPNVNSTATAPGGTGTTVPDDLYIVSVHLLCVTCKEPIRGTITTERWIKIEGWISPEGECGECHRQRKEAEREQGRT
jgi:hypothetical protein